MEPVSSSPVADIVCRQLSAMGAARKAFMESESSERIKRALRHNMTSSSNQKFFNGDTVYFKRMDCRKWKGPGKVIGHDSQQILIKHGGTYVRVHLCRVMLEKSMGGTESNTENDSSEDCDDRIARCESKRSNENLVARKNGSTSESSDEFSLNMDHSQPENSQDQSRVEQHSSSPMVQHQNAPAKTPRDTTGIPAELDQSAKLKKDSKIMYKLADDDEWISARVLSRAGKVTGKYSHHWNILNSGEDSPSELNFATPDLEWKFHQADTSTDEINLCDVYLSHVNKEVEDAKSKELQTWVKEGVYEEVLDEGQEAVSVRWVVTPKLIDGKMSTKARLVARGFEEDTSVLRTDSPTCMKDSLRLLFALSVSKNWSLNSIDIKAAFLQGNPIERKLYLRPPKEANQPDKLWLLRKVVYGLSDASRVWYLRVVGELKKLGAVTSKYDKAVFIWRQQGEIEGILAAHVDDFLWLGTRRFLEKVINPLRDTFKISTESKDCFKYVGIHVSKSDDGVQISQKQYIDSLTTVELNDSSTQNKEAALDKVGVRAFRGIVGQLNWAANVSRPDMCFSSCELSTLQSNPTVADLAKANKALKEIKGEHVSIEFRPLKLEKLKLVVFCDASYGNLRDGGSQAGSLIFLFDGETAVPVSWSSHRLKRVARSTLCAETLAAVEALDSAYLISAVGAEVFGKQKLEVDLYTDNKSLYDAINTINVMLDKRLRVDIASLREMSENGDVSFFWIESKHQLADVLTKKGASKKKLTDVLRSSKLHLK